MRAHSSSERMANAIDGGGVISGYQLTVYTMATFNILCHWCGPGMCVLRTLVAW